MKRIESMLYIMATFIGAIVINGCVPVGSVTPLTDGDGGTIVDPIEGTPCSPTGAVQACSYPCWSDAIRACTNDRPGDPTPRWTRCTPIEAAGHDTCTPDAGPITPDAGPIVVDSGTPGVDAGASCIAPVACTTPCGNLGLNLCSGGVLSATCSPIAPALETCAAADGGVDSGTPGVDAGTPDDAGTDSGPVLVDAGVDAGDDAGTDAGPVLVDAGVVETDAGSSSLVCGGCTDPLAGRVCTTGCGFLGAQTCGECLAGGPCHPIAPSLEVCTAVDAGVDAGPAIVDAGTDSGPVLVDAGVDAGNDAGTDAGPVLVDAGVDAGTDGGPVLVDAGTDAGPAPVDAGTDSGPAPVDAGTDSGPVLVDAGVDAGAGSDASVATGTPGFFTIQISGATNWCPSGGVADIRGFDSLGSPFRSNFTNTVVVASSRFIVGDVINWTVYCQTDGNSLMTWVGYVSPVVGASALNSVVSASDFPAIYEGTCDVRPGTFYCWDTSHPRTPDYRRFQFAVVPPSCVLPTGCYGTTGL
ncbi:MAG: hypothetical protein WCK01_00040 [Candidatus Uhrbacteria bacterium]